MLLEAQIKIAKNKKTEMNLIKKLLIIVAFSGPVFFSEALSRPNAQEAQTPVKGSLLAKKGVNLEGYTVYFNGYRTTTNSQGGFQMQANLDLSKDPVHILVSSGIDWETSQKSHTIKKARQNPQKPYKFYSVRLHQENPDEEPKLKAIRENLDSKGFEIPIERCLIFPVNAHFVKDIKLPHNLMQGGVLNLPKLVLQDDAPLKAHKTKKLADAGTDKSKLNYKVDNLMRRGKDKSVLRSLEWDPFHEKVNYHVMKTKNKMNKPVEITIYENT